MISTTGRDHAAPVRSVRTGLLLVATLGFAGWAHGQAAETAGLWNMVELQQPPVVQWGARDGLVQEVYYDNEPLDGKATRVFAYLARPAAPEAKPGASASGKFPAIVLVHGGGGQAFRAWAEQWARRGYAALAMDLSGNGPGKVRMTNGGPPLGNSNVFVAADSEAGLRQGWTYHAVAAVIRGHSLLAALPEVDQTRIGLTGMSWGGYLTCIVAGLDHRFKVAVPVYGCGFLQDSSHWKTEFIDSMKPESRILWTRFCDPSAYLPEVACPILFVNGTNDPRFFLDSHRRSYAAVPAGLAYLAITVGLKHGHKFDLREVERFVDAALRGGPLPPRFGAPELVSGRARVRLLGPAGEAKAEVHYAPATGPWLGRKWTTQPADIEDLNVSAALPADGPVVVYFSLLDAQGLRATSAYAEFAP